MPLQRFPVPDVAPPPRPEYFDNRYALPEHREYPLAKYNYHPQDEETEFFEEPHVYRNKKSGKCFTTSMTTVAHSRQGHFDGPAVIGKMKTSKKGWPRVKYVKDAQLVDRDDPVSVATLLVPSRGAMIVRDESTVVAIKAHDFADDVTGQSLCDTLDNMQTKRPRDPLPIYSFEREYTDAEILQMWADNGEDARNRGTEAHLQMQWACEATPFRTDDPEVILGLKFFNVISSEWRAYRTEWEVHYNNVA